MRLICGTHETEDGKALAGSFGQVTGKPQIGPYAAMGWIDETGVKTVALFNDYNGANIELHIIGRLTRQVLQEGLRYAFLQLNVQRVTAKPYHSNSALQSILSRIGFECEGVLRRYYGSHDDAVVFRLDRSAAEKWMK